MSNQPHTIEPSAAMMQIISAPWLCQAIAATVRLNVPDLLAEGPRNADDLAQEAGAHGESLYRALRALAGAGILTQDKENRFGLTPMSELLRSDVPGSMRHMVLLTTHDCHWRPWGALDHSIKTGQPAFDHVFGADFFTHAGQNPETQQVFNDAMTSFASAGHSAVSQAYDFNGVDTLMDVGGGHGTLLASILKAHPVKKGILFDLPHVLEGAGPVLDKWGVADRVELAGGSFFEALPGPVDACILSTVIHDWDDERALKILRNCHAATVEGGKVLLSEMVIPPGDSPTPGKFMDLNMLVMTPGGRERTEEQYRTLFAEAGYELARIVPTPSPVSVVEGIRRD